MSEQDTQSIQAALERLMNENELNTETRLFRQNLQEFVAPTEAPGIFRVSANPDPSEAVIDVYGQGYISLATNIGPGLAFTDARDNEWRDEERVGIEVRLGDALDQGGLIYPVESVITARVWYLTLPQGGVQVRKIT